MKKGQVTMFIIVGIVILVVVGMIFMIKSGNVRKLKKENLNQDLEAINQHINDCIDKVAEDPVRRIGMQGGYLSTPGGTYRYFNDTSISYLCYSLDNGCMNRMLTRDNMELELAKNINFLLQTCIDLSSFESERYDIIIDKKWDVTVDIAGNVIVDVNYPLSLQSTKSTTRVSNQGSYIRTYNVPLNELYKVAMDIIEKEARGIDFDILSYMLMKKDYKIIKLRPYPDKVYIINKDGYTFQFSVEGKEYEAIGQETKWIGKVETRECVFYNYVGECIQWEE